jgi:hypothetical protein
MKMAYDLSQRGCFDNWSRMGWAIGGTEADRHTEMIAAEDIEIAGGFGSVDGR